MRNRIKRHFLLILIFLFLVFACKKEVKQTQEKEEPCFKKVEKERAIEAILDSEKFQEILDSKTKDRRSIKLLESYFVRPELRIKSNGQLVLFNDTLHNENTYELRIIEVDCQLKKAKFSIWSSMEKILIKGIVQKTDSSWTTTITTKRKVLSKLDKWKKMKKDKLRN